MRKTASCRKGFSIKTISQPRQKHELADPNSAGTHSQSVPPEYPLGRRSSRIKTIGHKAQPTFVNCSL